MIDVPKERPQARDRPREPDGAVRILVLDRGQRLRLRGRIVRAIVPSLEKMSHRSARRRVQSQFPDVRQGEVTVVALRVPAVDAALPPLLSGEEFQEGNGVVGGDGAQELRRPRHTLERRADATRDHPDLRDDPAGEGDRGEHELVVDEDLVRDDASEEPNLE